MLCERCKIREANIQYTEVVNGVKTEHHFCAQCAKEMDFGPYAAIFDSEFPLGKLLSGLLGIGEEQEEQKEEQERLSKIRAKLLSAGNEMHEWNMRNQALLQQALEMVEFDLTLFKSMRQAPETANYDKNAYNTGDLLGNSGFDAKQ